MTGQLTVGDYTVRVLEASHFRLDGGGMFGIVPRTMWSRLSPPDDLNRIAMGTTCLLAEGNGRRVLIETGCGDKMGPKDREIYAIENPGGILDVLAESGIEPDTIDAVVVSHAHFDHIGGATTAGDDGRSMPAFPNARVFVQGREWSDALANRSHMKTTYRPENLEPLADRVQLLDGPAVIAPGIRVEPAPGHTIGHQCVLIDGDQPLCFVGDLIPTHVHLRPLWTMSYDIEPATTNATRAGLIRRAIDEDWMIFFPHDPRMQAVTVELDEKGRWAGRPVEL